MTASRETHDLIDQNRDDPEYQATVAAIARREGRDPAGLMDEMIADTHAIADRPGGPQVEPNPEPEPTGPVSPQLKKFRELLR